MKLFRAESEIVCRFRVIMKIKPIQPGLLFRGFTGITKLGGEAVNYLEQPPFWEPAGLRTFRKMSAAGCFRHLRIFPDSDNLRFLAESQERHVCSEIICENDAVFAFTQRCSNKRRQEFQIRIFICALIIFKVTWGGQVLGVWPRLLGSLLSKTAMFPHIRVRSFELKWTEALVHPRLGAFPAVVARNSSQLNGAAVGITVERGGVFSVNFNKQTETLLLRLIHQGVTSPHLDLCWAAAHTDPARGTRRPKSVTGQQQIHVYWDDYTYCGFMNNWDEAQSHSWWNHQNMFFPFWMKQSYLNWSHTNSNHSFKWTA